jgi:tRNA-Thr(GGU) m(6)t(6)A37 methyltransferase TsaA
MTTLRTIGVVRSDVRARNAMPPLGAPAQVEVFPEYAAGLFRLEKHSHIWVLAWLEAERDVLQVTPRGVPDRSPAGLHGVFAVRSPARPNPIGLTAARIVAIEERMIELDRLDFLDGTPVIDLKPYFASRDLIFSAVNRQIGRPASRDALRESLLMQAVNFHGEFCAGVAIGVRVVEHWRSGPLSMSEPESPVVQIPPGHPCLFDAMMGMLRVTPGRAGLVPGTPGSLRFEHRGSVYDYRILVSEASDADSILAAPDETLFDLR